MPAGSDLEFQFQTQNQTSKPNQARAMGVSPDNLRRRKDKQRIWAQTQPALISAQMAGHCDLAGVKLLERSKSGRGTSGPATAAAAVGTEAVTSGEDDDNTSPGEHRSCTDG